MCFVWIEGQTASISLKAYCISCMVFIIEIECVYCAVGAESLCVVQVKCSLQRAKM